MSTTNMKKIYITPNRPPVLGKATTLLGTNKVNKINEDTKQGGKIARNLFNNEEYEVDEEQSKSKKSKQNHTVESIIDNYVGHITSITINDMECSNDYNLYMIKSNYENTFDNTHIKLIKFVNTNNLDYYIVIKACEQYNISNMMTSRVGISTYLRNCIAIASFLSVLNEENCEKVVYNLNDFLSEDKQDSTSEENKLIIEMINLIFNKNRSDIARNKEWMLFPYLVNVLGRIGSVGLNDLKDYFYEECEGTDEDTDIKLQTLIKIYCNRMNNEEILVNNKYFTEIYNARIKKNNAILRVVKTITKSNLYDVMLHTDY